MFADSVPFFNWTLSPFLFTLLLQTGLIVTFFTMAVRRWQKASKHSLSKIYSLCLLSVFVLLFIGNLWPVIAGKFLPFRIFGIGNLEAIKEEIGIALPLMYAVGMWLMCTFLYSIFVPSHHAYIRGVRRARKLGKKAARPWDDDSASIPFMGISIAIASIGFWILLSEMVPAGYMDTFEPSRSYNIWRLPLALGLALFCTLLLLQVLEMRGTMLAALLIWTLPVLIAIVSGAAMERMTNVHAILAAVSPIALILMSGLLPLEGAIPLDPDGTFDAMRTGTQAGFIFITLQIALLGWRWMHLRRKLR
jgi:hypothetical protein